MPRPLCSPRSLARATRASVGPGIVDGGSDVLYKAQWHYIDNQTLTHPSIQITVPGGWSLVSSDPTGCTQTGLVITCARDTIRQGDYVRQAVELTTWRPKASCMGSQRGS